MGPKKDEKKGKGRQGITRTLSPDINPSDLVKADNAPMRKKLRYFKEVQPGSIGIPIQGSTV